MISDSVGLVRTSILVANNAVILCKWGSHVTQATAVSNRRHSPRPRRAIDFIPTSVVANVSRWGYACAGLVSTGLQCLFSLCLAKRTRPADEKGKIYQCFNSTKVQWNVSYNMKQSLIKQMFFCLKRAKIVGNLWKPHNKTSILHVFSDNIATTN